MREAYNLFEVISEQSARWPDRNVQKKPNGVLEVDAYSLMLAKIEALSKKVEDISLSTPKAVKVVQTQQISAFSMLTGPEEPVIRQESPRFALRTERLEALGHQTVFIQDAVNALHKVGKALDKLNLSAAEEIGGVTSDLYNIANALQVLPQLIKVALSNIQQQRKEILEKEQAKYTSFAARSVIAFKASGTKLTGHDKNLDDLSLSLQTLADKFNRIKGKQDDVLDLVQSINSHVSEINARKGEEESREVARRWRLQKEAEIDAVFEERIAAAINRLGASHQRYKVSGSRPEFQDPNVPWKDLIRPPAPVNLPTDRQPSPEEIKQWRKTQLMRYFVVHIRDSTIFDRCKTLAEAATEFTARLEKGNLPLQLAMRSKHRKGDQITHPEDWIHSYDKSYEGMAIYQNRVQDALVNWWKNTKHDPNRQRPWRHEHQFRR
ncbi:hypothetical protein OROMI_006342 [Orobanche minor]